MKIKITDNNAFEIVSKAGQTLLESAYGTYSKSSNAYRGARKARIGMLANNLTVTEDGQTVQLKSNNGHILAERSYFSKSNAMRGFNSIKQYLKTARELAQPLPISR
jgi:uncharacterized protein YegP (UPF0339 family)